MLFSYRAFTHAKDPEQQDQDQDAYGVSPEAGVAVIADGVSSAIFSAAWAKILAKSVLADFPPEPDADMPAFLAWLDQRRKTWNASINTDNLAWFQKPKLATGAFSTLLWLRLEPCGFPGDDWPGEKDLLDPDKPCFWLTATAIGDSCLFHIRAGRPDFGRFDGTDLMRVFPVENSTDFEASPAVLGSVDLKRDGALAFQRLGIIVQEGDFVVLATDALSQWALRGYEAGYAPGWENFWAMPETQWRTVIDQHRQQGNMRYDDATLLMMQVGQPHDISAEPEAPAVVEVETYDEPEVVAPPRATKVVPAPVEPEMSLEVPEDDDDEIYTFKEPDPPQESEPPVRPGFRYSLAGDKTAGQPGAKSRDFTEDAQRRQREADSWVERSADIGNRVSEQLDTLREKGAQVAGNLGEKISDGMNTVGEATHQFVDAAKPKIRQAFRGVMGFFRKDKAGDTPDEPDEDTLRKQHREQADRRAAERKADPNRKRFYRPKSDENDNDTKE